MPSHYPIPCVVKIISGLTDNACASLSIVRKEGFRVLPFSIMLIVSCVIPLAIDNCLCVIPRPSLTFFSFCMMLSYISLIMPRCLYAERFCNIAYRI